MHIGHFTQASVGISETFIHDLMQDLNRRAACLTFFCGASKGTPIEGIPTVFTGYYELPAIIAYPLFKLGLLMGRKGRSLNLKFQQLSASYRLSAFKKELTALDVAYIEYGTSAPVLCNLFRKVKLPYVIHVHAYDVTSAFADECYKETFVDACNVAHAIVVVSKHIKRLLILAGIDEERIVVVRLGIKEQAIAPMSWENRRKSPPSVIHLGRLVPKKHPVALLHAFALVQQEVPDARLTIIGDGPLMGEVIERIKQLRLEDCVTLTGALGREEAFPILNRHWVFAQHSVTSIKGDQEGFPVSPSEAAMHGLPVVSTLHSGIPEGVIDGETGFLVQEHDFETMAQRMIYLLRNPDIAEAMGQAGRNRISQLCNPEERADKIYDLLHGACLSRSSELHVVGEEYAFQAS